MGPVSYEFAREKQVHIFLWVWDNKPCKDGVARLSIRKIGGIRMKKTPMGFITINVPIMADRKEGVPPVSVNVSRNPDYIALMQREVLPAGFFEVYEATYRTAILQALEELGRQEFQLTVE